MRERSRPEVLGVKCAKQNNSISFNLFEPLGMVMTAYVMVVQESDHSNVVGAPVVMLDGNSVSAVT